MDDHDQQLNHVLALSDQAWTGLSMQHDSIKRISEGDIIECDRALIQMMACVVLGEIHMRNA